METTATQFVCVEHDGTRKFESTTAIRLYLDSKYADSYQFKKDGKYLKIICNSSVIGVIKKISGCGVNG